MNRKEWAEIVTAAGYADIFKAKYYNEDAAFDISLTVKDIREINSILIFIDKLRKKKRERTKATKNSEPAVK